jgi:hypothetical protein
MATLIPKYTKVTTANRTIAEKFGETVSVKDFGAVGDGVADDTAAIQAAFNTFSSTTNRNVYFPPGQYSVTSTLVIPANTVSAQIIGGSGMDGGGGGSTSPYLTLTNIIWDGAIAAVPVVQADRGSGIIWSGVSIDCNEKADYGIQFYSSTTSAGCTFNTFQNCTIKNAQLDGIILGVPGTPTATPGQRQFYENRFINLHFFGCLQSGVHVNEWNADLLYFETVNVFANGRASKYGFWFDYGGQQSKLINCVTSGLVVVGGSAGTGYSIYNRGNNNSSVGAFGLTVIGFWQEGDGGLYYGQTGNDEGKSYSFINCNSFTGATPTVSVYIASGTTNPIPYTFVGCNFLSDLKLASPLFGGYINLINCIFASGKGVLDYSDNLTTNGIANLGSFSGGGGLTLPQFATVAKVTLTSNVGVVYAENGFAGNKYTVIVTQDAVGSRTITWGAAFASSPAIPAPTATANAVTTYTFVSDGTLNYLVGYQ